MDEDSYLIRESFGCQNLWLSFPSQVLKEDGEQLSATDLPVGNWRAGGEQRYFENFTIISIKSRIKDSLAP